VLRDSNFPRAPFAAKCGLHASMIFPVFLGGEVVAAFEFFSRGRRAFDDDVTLMMANIGKQVALLMERSRADESREAMHRELLEASHEAGMAEVATGILHNVGNVLNSVNISAQIVCDKLQHSRVSKLGLVAQMLTEHESDLPDFLSNDERGSQLPAYLCQLVDHLNGETRVISDEMDALAKNVDHIKEIVNTQQAYAGSGGFIETLDLRELLEDALRIYAASFARHDVTLICEIGDAPPICADKHKVLQILVNLIGNACQAMADAPVRKLTLRVMTTEIGGVRVSVRDTGYGILPENMTRIFSHAFTTKKDGHGFGLHSSALAAKELKGSLTVHSDGPGKGAIFTLELPPAIQEALIK
jgi:signal transduction histidine kinase